MNIRLRPLSYCRRLIAAVAILIVAATPAAAKDDLIIGMGLPTTAAYVLVAAVLAPALTAVGVEPLGGGVVEGQQALLRHAPAPGQQAPVERGDHVADDARRRHGGPPGFGVGVGGGASPARGAAATPRGAAGAGEPGSGVRAEGGRGPLGDPPAGPGPGRDARAPGPQPW